MSTSALIRGSFFPFLETELFRAIGGSKATDPLAPVIVLVGSNLLAAHLRRHLADFMPNGHIGVQFLTFPDLAKAIVRSRHSDLDDRLLTSLNAAAATYFAVSEKTPESDDGDYFAPVSHFPGFHRALARTICELDEECISSLPDGTDKSFPAALNGNKISSLEKLRRKTRRLSGNKMTFGDLFRSAADLADSYARVFRTSDLYVYGFYDMNGAQKQLMQALAASCAVHYFLPVPEATDPNYVHYQPYTGNFEKWLDSLGFGNLPGTSRAAPDSQNETKPSIKIISASGPTAEVKEIARKILQDARKGSHFDEMMIVLRNESTYTSLITEIFDESGIPVFLRSGRPFADTRAGRCLLLIDKLRRQDATRAALMEFAAECGTAQPLWDIVSKEAAITLWPGDSVKRLLRLKAKASHQQDHGRVEQIDKLASFSSALAADIDVLPKSGTFLVFTEWIEKFIRKFIAPALENESGSKPGEDLDNILKSLRGLHDLRSKIDVDDFFAFLGQAVENLATKAGAFQRGVTVASIVETRGLHARHVFVPGMLQGSFPASPHQDPLLLDKERAAINSYLTGKDPSASGLPLKRARSNEENLLFDLVLGAGTESITLSYPRADAISGKENSKSWFLTELEESRANRNDLKLSFEVPLGSPEHAGPDGVTDETEFHLSFIQSSNFSISPGQGGYFDVVLPNLSSAASAIHSRWTNPLLTSYDGHVSSADAAKVIGKALEHNGYSPTRLEDYWACPFSYFITSIVGARSVNRPEEVTETGPHHIGTAIHETLHDFFKELGECDLLPLQTALTDQYRSRLLAILDSKLSHLHQRHPTGHRLLWSMKKDQIRKDLLQLLDHEISVARVSSWTPAEFEYEFDGIGFSLPDGNVMPISGKIDRIDVVAAATGTADATQHGIRVVDYKSGKLERKSHSFKIKNPLQLPIYLLAACKSLNSRIELSQADFVATSTAGRPSTVLSGESWKQTGEELSIILSMINQGIHSGFFPPFPDESDTCRTWCANARACASSRPSPFDSKPGNEALAQFKELRNAK